MIGADMAAVLVVENPAQQLGEGTQQSVAFREAVLVIVKLHSEDIDIQERGGPSILPDRFPFRFGQLEEIRHAGEPGQIVVTVLLQDAFLVERVVQPTVQLRAAAFLVLPFRRIPDMSNLRPRLSDLVLADGMDDNVVLAPLFLRPVDDVILAALGGKPHGFVGNARDVVRVHFLVHIVIHVVIRLHPILIVPEQFAKPIRKGKGDDLFVHKLIDSIRLLQSFKEELLFLCEFVSIHTQNAALSCGYPSLPPQANFGSFGIIITLYLYIIYNVSIHHKFIFSSAIFSVPVKIFIGRRKTGCILPAFVI